MGVGVAQYQKPGGIFNSPALAAGKLVAGAMSGGAPGAVAAAPSPGSGSQAPSSVASPDSSSSAGLPGSPASSAMQRRLNQYQMGSLPVA